MERKYSYDEECERLARHFLADERHVTERAVRDLAQEIQDVVEGWLSVTDLILINASNAEILALPGS